MMPIGQPSRDNFRMYEPPMSRRDLALEAGYDPSAEDLLPPASHLPTYTDAEFGAALRASRFVGALTRCSHPHCRTSLTDETAVFCDHNRPFCEHCMWLDGCDECNTAYHPERDIAHENAEQRDIA